LKNLSISATRQKIKKLAGSFFVINMKNLYAKFQPSSFKTEGGVWHDFSHVNQKCEVKA